MRGHAEITIFNLDADHRSSFAGLTKSSAYRLGEDKKLPMRRIAGDHVLAEGGGISDTLGIFPDG